MRIIKTEVKKLRTPEQQRKAKGLKLFQDGHAVVMNADATEFKVKSACDKGFYSVLLTETANACTCPDYAFNRIDNCKHIYAAKYARHECGYPLQL